MEVMKGAERKIGHVVGRVFAAAKGLFPLVEHADHGIETGFDVDLFTDGVLTTEQLFPGIVSQHNHVLSTLVLLVGPETALYKSEIGNQSHLRRGTLQDGPRDLL